MNTNYVASEPLAYFEGLRSSMRELNTALGNAILDEVGR